MYSRWSLIILSVGMVSAALPALAAESPDGASGRLGAVILAPAGTAVWDHAFADRAPLTDRQIATDRVDGKALRLQQDEAADRPGEDGLGSGTSMTH